ncbi:MAG: DUF4381 domain-containing protein [Proteobacteria bacterium]|nr:DUF4381 domain-containing protein [Pseudomonadota bacterium]
MNEQTLNLRDIHLPEPISWWPLAPGWWILFVSLVVIITALYIAKKIYQSRQLSREITSELDDIKKEFAATQNKSQLAKALSILLRRACITYYPENNIAGLTGENWLEYLDATFASNKTQIKFQDPIGHILLDAPYLPDETALNYDDQALIQLCESWLGSAHKKMPKYLSSQAQKS